MDKQYKMTSEQIKKLINNGFDVDYDDERLLNNITLLRNNETRYMVYQFEEAQHNSFYMGWCDEYLLENILEYNLECGAHPFPFCFHPKECKDNLDLFIDFIIKVKKEAGV